MKVLVATDGSECSAVAIEELARRPLPVDSHVRVISAVETYAPLTAEPWAAHADYYGTVARTALGYNRSINFILRSTRGLTHEAQLRSLQVAALRARRHPFVRQMVLQVSAILP
jgi:hypothetical protein